MKDLRSNRQTEGLPGQQTRPEGDDEDSKESGESEDDYTADWEVRVTRSKNQSEIQPDLVQLTCIGQQEICPAPVSRHIESEDTGISAPTSQLSVIRLTVRISMESR